MEVKSESAFKVTLGNTPDGQMPSIRHSIEKVYGQAQFEESYLQGGEIQRGQSEQVYFVLSEEGGVYIQG